MNIYPNHPGAADVDTSIAAAEAVAPKASTIREAILRLLGSMDRGLGLTPDETAARLNLSVLTVRPRFTELAQMGLIERTGTTRTNRSGRKAHVWMLPKKQLTLI